MLANSLSLFLVLQLSSMIIDGKEIGFSYKYYPEVGWFNLYLVPANWAEARLRCNLEGVPLSKIPLIWAPNEPDNFEDSENCLMLLTNGTMADVKCEEVFPYVCYKKDLEIVESGCGTADYEYRLDPRTGSCYKFHSIGQTWQRAYMTCAAEGGYLGIINSELESQVFKELFANFWEKKIVSRDPDVAFIGFHDWDEHGTWRTIHGDTHKVAGFAKWSADHTDNWKTGQYCGSIFRTGLLKGIDCYKNLAFLCEKSPYNNINNEEQSDS